MAAPSRVSGLRLAAARLGLPAWFIAIDLLWIAKPDVLGIDARHYQRAASAWLAGGDPWAVIEGAGGNYAAGPHTLLFYAPTSLLPLAVSVAFWMALGLAASVWLVRRLQLPPWWLLFPPLVHSIWNGNPQTIALALLVLGGPLAAAAAVGLKLYTGLALVTRPRTLVFVGLVVLVTLLVLPWQLYLDNNLGIGDHLSTAWNGSAWRLPILIPPSLLALWILRRKGAEWLAVPAIWPATQFYYVAMALPALVGRPILAAAFALPVPLLTPVAVIVLAVLEFRRDPAVLRPAFAMRRR
jgi:hypothetical protein